MSTSEPRVFQHNTKVSAQLSRLKCDRHVCTTINMTDNRIRMDRNDQNHNGSNNHKMKHLFHVFTVIITQIRNFIRWTQMSTSFSNLSFAFLHSNSFMDQIFPTSVAGWERWNGCLLYKMLGDFSSHPAIWALFSPDTETFLQNSKGKLDGKENKHTILMTKTTCMQHNCNPNKKSTHRRNALPAPNNALHESLKIRSQTSSNDRFLVCPLQSGGGH